MVNPLLIVSGLMLLPEIRPHVIAPDEIVVVPEIKINLLKEITFYGHMAMHWWFIIESGLCDSQQKRNFLTMTGTLF